MVMLDSVGADMWRGELLCARGHGVQLGCTVVLCRVWVNGAWVGVEAHVCITCCHEYMTARKRFC